MQLVCCKNKQSYNTISNKFPQINVINTGFTSIDRYNEQIPKKHDYFLHLKGISRYKNSQVLVDTWLKHPEWPTLVVVHHGNQQSNGTLHFNIPFKVSKNIIVYQNKLPDATLKSIMNQCGVHICCSFSEGFGHYINEARSTGAYLITTDGLPMKEFLKNNESGILIPPVKKISLNYGEGYFISSTHIERIINTTIHQPGKILLQKGSQNRKHYINDKESFYTKIQQAIKNLC
jgi:glycosyltransferase involved in cell wall biosynthesis